jgi:hypothetical protein
MKEVVISKGLQPGKRVAGKVAKIWSACEQRKFNTKTGERTIPRINMGTILPA